MKSDSVFISYVLRHKPEAINLDMDRKGWVSISQLISNAPIAKRKLTKESILEIVKNDEKGRYAISNDGKSIRALQGHSISKDVVCVGFEKKTPPSVLYHGTATRFMDSIKEKGLVPNNRQYVHLSSDKDTAINVGNRHGTPIILEIDTSLMIEKGHSFYLSENNVWLTEAVPISYISVSYEQSYNRKIKMK